MPKIEVNESAFFALASGKPEAGHAPWGIWGSRDRFEEALTCAKAELDEPGDEGLPAGERTMKIELNDTNRPDLWGTSGCARQLRRYHGGPECRYPFFSSPGAPQKAGLKVQVEGSVRGVRPFLAGFVASGATITDASLRDLIQTQEKLAWNFGRKRRSLSMGLYRRTHIKWPVIYRGSDPQTAAFVPLQWETLGDKPEKLTLSEILVRHPKGREYAFILENEAVHPLLTDSAGEILSYPPIINSADSGAVQVGDTDIFVELTGTDIHMVSLAASIVACDLADNGFTVEPVEVEYAFDTPLGRNIVYPFYFQEPVVCSLSQVERLLGEKLSAEDCVRALARMGVKAEPTDRAERGRPEGQAEPGILAWPPEYRNDFLHAADIVEDIMIGRGLGSFAPESPREPTVGRLAPLTLFGRKVKELFVGMGYQEMVYNYLGSRRHLADNMRSGGERIIRIANPMTENYEYLRDSVIASLVASEAVSAHAMYPHMIFEVGKVAFLDPAENSGTATGHWAGFLHADREAGFNTAASQLQTLFYHLSCPYLAEEADDPRFIEGRAARLIHKGRPVGIFGELHPEVLTNWGITVPCVAGEFDLEELM
ncbi:MAG: phenylalanine--tRNA ligase subunit beta [Treponema sp.]|nr:phenylalanine--tRNA ligase subunit beta [Treponema sp.]